MGRELRFETMPVFEPFLQPSRYKAAHGGRGSAKSHFFADHLIEYSIMEPGNSGQGLFAACLRQVQKSLKDSAKRLIETKLKQHGLGEADGFKVFNDVIQTPKDGQIVFQGMQEHTAESIKSMEGIKVAWWEEAQTAAAHSLALLRPTLRADGSELWFSWNPRRPTDPVDKLFRGKNKSAPTGSIIVKSNWRDNLLFPSVLEQERLDCLRDEPGQYPHIWEGEYATVLEGAYYAEALSRANLDGRITRVRRDNLHPVYAFMDLGGMGMHGDATCIWVAQFCGLEILVLDYYEAVGQAAKYHINWLKKHYEDAKIYLPHDGAPQNPLYEGSWETALREAGFSTEVVPNQGAGARMQRIEAGRRWFDRMIFDDIKTQPGRDALGWHHANLDRERGIDLGPYKDWSIHGADAFGLMAIVYRPPALVKREKHRYSSPNSWMG